MRSLALWALFLLAGAPAGSVFAEIAPKPAKAITPPSSEWVANIMELAPGGPTVAPKRKREVLLFDLFTGFDHKVIPHANAAIRAIAEKTGAFSVTPSADIEMFGPRNIGRFDGVILNNCCSQGPGRNIFLDVLRGAIKDPRNAAMGERYKGLGEDERNARAAALEKGLIDHIASGKGLIVVHGGIVMQNDSRAFGEMVGGSFDYHPKAQEFSVCPVDGSHPLLKAFGGEPFTHTDEPYLFKGAYAKKDFRPLLMMRAADIQGKREGAPVDDTLYVSWIKRFGKGRVFFVSPSHFPESYQSRAMLRFYLDGIQYALGDLDCDDAPLAPGRN